MRPATTLADRHGDATTIARERLTLDFRVRDVYIRQLGLDFQRRAQQPRTDTPSPDRVEMASFFNPWKTTLRICKVSSLGSRLKL